MPTSANTQRQIYRKTINKKNTQAAIKEGLRDEQYASSEVSTEQTKKYSM